MRLGHTLDVSLVNDRLVIRDARGVVGTPVEERVDHDAGHGVAERIDHRRSAAGGGILGVQVVGIQRLTEVEIAVEGLAVRVQQKLAGVAPVAVGRVPRSVHPIPIALPGRDGRQVGVPDETVDLVEFDPGLVVVVVDQTEFHPVGHFGEQ